MLPCTGVIILLFCELIHQCVLHMLLFKPRNIDLGSMMKRTPTHMPIDSQMRGKHSSLLCSVFSFSGFHSDQMATLRPFNDLRGSPLLGHRLLCSISPPVWILLLVRPSHNEAYFIRFVFIHPSGSSLGLHGVSVLSTSPVERPLLSKESQ